MIKNYEEQKEELFPTVVENYIQHYLPWILIAKQYKIPIHTLINNLPHSYKTIYFTNVALLKSISQTLNEADTNGHASLDVPFLKAIMTPQIKEPNKETIKKELNITE